MDDRLVLSEHRGRVALLALNRPEARNAVNRELAEAICSAVEEAQQAAAIVITGADPAFCAGLDLRDVGVDRLSEMPSFIGAVASSETPVIAAVNGPAVTGGLELALAADFIVASERACSPTPTFGWACTRGRVWSISPGGLARRGPGRCR